MSSAALQAPLGVHTGRDTGIRSFHVLYLHFQMEAAKRGTCSHLWPTEMLPFLSPPPPTTVQGYTLSGRSETSYNPLSLQQPPARLRSHLSTFHSMKEKPWCQPIMYLVTSRGHHCKPPERGAAAWAALGTSWCLGEISSHQGCIPSPTPH